MNEAPEAKHGKKPGNFTKILKYLL